MTFRKLIKTILAKLGFLHPALGVKISGLQKVEKILKYNTSDTFVETGTEFGTTLLALQRTFKNLYSIELDEELYAQVKELFKDDQHIHLFQGDSAEKIKDILKDIKGHTTFWLDAHAPGHITRENSPTYNELLHILAHGNHTLLIDDARHFSKGLIKDIYKLSKRHGYKCKIEDGLFVIKA